MKCVIGLILIIHLSLQSAIPENVTESREEKNLNNETAEALDVTIIKLFDKRSDDGSVREKRLIKGNFKYNPVLVG
ncbi:hypothetical protein RN001_003872 [Aquatica leii]|uniref:Uncharacterized protein n=1 Tax=Aquatica leii TaxID=1421715 RepID=A0AAN7PRL3_9COLE|nr:hypothetical protein RN001_003872 [Aquatica leii]